MIPLNATMGNLKMTTFWDTAPCSLVEVEISEMGHCLATSLKPNFSHAHLLKADTTVCRFRRTAFNWFSPLSHPHAS
jgi:hypothetical protein